MIDKSSGTLLAFRKKGKTLEKNKYEDVSPRNFYSIYKATFAWIIIIST